jgi:hypothetical protein
MSHHRALVKAASIHASLEHDPVKFWDAFIEIGESKIVDMIVKGSINMNTFNALHNHVELYYFNRASIETDLSSLPLRDATRGVRFLLEFALTRRWEQGLAIAPSKTREINSAIALAKNVVQARAARSTTIRCVHFPDANVQKVVDGEVHSNFRLADATTASFMRKKSHWIDEEQKDQDAFRAALFAETGASLETYQKLAAKLTSTTKPHLNEIDISKASEVSGVVQAEALNFFNYHTFDPEAVNKREHLVDRPSSIFSQPFLPVPSRKGRFIYSPSILRISIPMFLRSLEHGTQPKSFYQSVAVQKYVEETARSRERRFEISILDTSKHLFEIAEHDYSLGRFCDRETANKLGRVDVFLFSRSQRLIILVEAKYLNAVQYEPQDAAQLIDRFFFQVDKDGKPISYETKWSRRQNFVATNVRDVIKVLGGEIDDDWMVRTIVVTSRNSVIDQFADLRLGQDYVVWPFERFKRFMADLEPEAR